MVTDLSTGSAIPEEGRLRCRYVPTEGVTTTEITAREFNRDVSAAKRAASTGPVIITDRGQPSYVLLSIEDYRHLRADERSIVDWLTADDDIDLEVDRAEVALRVPQL